jgi:hypothetical protein
MIFLKRPRNGIGSPRETGRTDAEDRCIAAKSNVSLNLFATLRCNPVRDVAARRSGTGSSARTLR